MEVFVSWIANAIQIASAVAIIGLWVQQQVKPPVVISLHRESGEVFFQFTVPAKDYSRGELSGRIGALTNKFVKAKGMAGRSYLEAVDAASKSKVLNLVFTESEIAEYFSDL